MQEKVLNLLKLKRTLQIVLKNNYPSYISIFYEELNNN